MDRDRSSVRNCKMRNELRRAVDPPRKGIALDHKPDRAPARAKAARTNRRDFDRRRNAADRQSALTVRGRREVRQPVRVVMTRSGKLPRSARFFTDRFAKNSFVYR